ncbi:MAG: metallophosphoesterase [Candidatus Gracilibacteria bacterium]|nr:metallophosphoesterase [Candidatus Gracilibacteria bacterium]
MKNINELLDITSDLHTDFIYKNFKTIYGKNGILKQKNKYLIVAGDINENIHTLKMSLDDIIDNTTYEKIIICLGNHDLRLNSDDIDNNITNSIEKYEFLINHFHNYREKIHIIDKEDFIIPNTNYIITGITGWYNYTIRNEDRFYLEKYYHANFDKMNFGGIYYNDRMYLKFNEKIKGNEEFAKYLENKLIERLEQIKCNYNNYEIIAISHVKPSRLLEKDSQYYIEYPFEKWEEIIKDGMKGIKLYGLDKIYGNAFFINNNLSKIYERYGVKYAIYGHTHYKGSEEINGIEYITNALGYYGLS